MAATELMDLPSDVMASILSWVGAAELLTRVQYVCREWKDICWGPLVWRDVRFDDIKAAYRYSYVDDRDENYIEEDRVSYKNGWRKCMEELQQPLLGLRLFNRLSCLAVERSLGSIERITIHRFATKESLLYIANRSRHIKQLRLFSCCRLREDCWISVAEKFPFLEELEFSFCSVSEAVVEAFARKCPLLVSFKYKNHVKPPWWPKIETHFRRSNTLAKVAHVVAHRTPSLIQLQIGGGRLTDDALAGILDGCPRLESLDLYKCGGFNLDGELGVRCSKQVKHLRRPSNDDYFEYHPHRLDIEYHLSASNGQKFVWKQIHFLFFGFSNRQ